MSLIDLTLRKAKAVQFSVFENVTPVIIAPVIEIEQPEPPKNEVEEPAKI